MNRIYGTSEPSAITRLMLDHAVYEQGPKGYAAKLAKEEGIQHKNVLNLRLDFKNILEIGNLDSFSHLVKLQLDNNIIEKIENISHLVNLKWLDLSFNNIRKIENLDNLVNLQDVSLYSNKISTIENLDNLKNLQIFSIGNNLINELDSVLYCRRFKKLRTINLKGNPICSSPEYSAYALAFLTALNYLDYSLINENEKAIAIEKYSLKVEEFAAQDAQDEEKFHNDKAVMDEYMKHIEAFVEDLNGSQLFEQAFKEDIEGNLLLELPNMEDMKKTFEIKFVDACQSLFEFGLSEFDRRAGEVKAFWDCVNEAKSQNSKKSRDLIEQFSEYKQNVFHQLVEMIEVDEAEHLIKEYRDEINLLWKNLMANELSLVEQLEDVVKDFSLSLNEMTDAFLENMEALMGQCREAEGIYHERVTEHCIVMIEKIMKGELDDELSEEVKMIFVDKDSLMGSLAGSHDIRMQVVDGKADNITTRIRQWAATILKDIHEEEEVRRNRQKVTEIVRLCDHLRNQLDSLEIPAFT
ncbi:Dynein regulatory complex subunit 3 [Cichlidogyrus casuarinus]|uniref:Dynein regulatory complex subunit 3 n=1 Tax=Cichlidogyrus casuarinus TaxID=1844966 RepID=A0ABD2Q4D2_9PLAT